VLQNKLQLSVSVGHLMYINLVLASIAASSPNDLFILNIELLSADLYAYTGNILGTWYFY